jgi:hypothetical protein
LTIKPSHGMEIFPLLIVALFFPFTYSWSSTIEESYEFSNKIATFSQPSLQDFRSSLGLLVNQSQYLTKSYHDEIGKWNSGKYDNYTLISITDSFLPKFENLINSAKNMAYPREYKNISEALVNSLESETDSYRHFRNYLVSGNMTEDETSTNLLSKALQYELIYSKFLSVPNHPNSHQNVTKLIDFNY